MSNNSGRIFVLDVANDGPMYILVSLYNGNTEPEQSKILEILSKISKVFQDISEKKYLFFDQKLEYVGGNPILKKLAVIKVIELKESLNFKKYARIGYKC